MQERRRLRALLVAPLVALLAAGAASADEKTTAVVLDRSGSIAHGDPRGDGRAALAFALALTARPGGRIVVFAAALDQPLEGDALSLEGLTPVLRTVMMGPSLGGSDLTALFKDAAAKGSLVVAYTTGELDVVGARGSVPAEVLAKARETSPRPDRRAVNEAARALLAEQSGKALEGKLVALRAALPEEARSVPFLDALGARVVDLAEKPLEATRRLAKELAGVELAAPTTVTLEGGHATIPVERGSRVVLLAEKPLKVATRRGLSLGGEDRAWVVDADAPLEVEGEAGSSVAVLAAPRASFEFTASAFRLASGAIHVTVAPRDRALPLAVRAEGQDLERLADGTFRGRLAATDAGAIKLSVGAAGALPDPSDLAVERALLTVEAADLPVAGARTKLVARATGLPAELLPASLGLTLVSGEKGAKKTSIELPRAGDVFQGEVVLDEGTWTLGPVRAGDLTVELRAPLAAKPAAVLVAKLVDAGKVKEGAASVLVDLAVDPPLAAGLAPQVAALHGGARLVEGTLKDKARFRVALSNVEPGSNELEFTLPLARGAEARAKVGFALEPAPSWKKPAAAALVGVGLLWTLVVFARRRALVRRFGDKQLRGLGSNGKMSYERYFLIDHREGRRAAVAPPGPTAVRIEVGNDGRARARALEGSKLLGQDGEVVKEALLVHETCIFVARELYRRRWVYLEREPTAEELVKRYVAGAPSYEGGEVRDSDVYVLLDERENMVPPSQRLVPLDSARLPQVNDVVQAESDESVVVTNSDEERVLDDEHAILDPGSDDSTLGDLESDDSVEE